MSELEERLSALKASAAEARKQEARAAATAETLREKIAEMERQLREDYEVDPVDAFAHLENLRALAEEAVAEAEAALEKVESA